jgi:hypothetical protein
MLIKILIGVAIVVAILVIVIASRPNEFRVSRSATMLAAPASIFAQVNDFHKWEAWSPWAKMDPNAKSTFEGPTSGNGAKFHWDGDKNIGAGSMTIVESRPNELIRIKLDFIRPFAGTNDVEFTFWQAGNGTAVTWAMMGRTTFVTKAIGLFMNCEKMVGDQYEKGLANIKSIVESEPSPVSAAS